MPAKSWTIGITGASGIRYGTRLIDVMLSKLTDCELKLIVSDSALRVFLEEEGRTISQGPAFLSQLLGRNILPDEQERIQILSNRDIGACIASGSFASNGMIVVPCSMNTLAAIAHGLSQTLIHRVADVTIKEKRPLILVPRESPLSTIHLENMLSLSRLEGVRIVPAMPGFYSKPVSVDDMVDAVVMRVLDQIGERLTITERWK